MELAHLSYNKNNYTVSKMVAIMIKRNKIKKMSVSKFNKMVAAMRPKNNGGMLKHPQLSNITGAGVSSTKDARS